MTPNHVSPRPPRTLPKPLCVLGIKSWMGPLQPPPPPKHGWDPQDHRAGVPHKTAPQLGSLLAWGGGGDAPRLAVVGQGWGHGWNWGGKGVVEGGMGWDRWDGAGRQPPMPGPWFPGSLCTRSSSP